MHPTMLERLKRMKMFAPPIASVNRIGEICGSKSANSVTITSQVPKI